MRLIITLLIFLQINKTSAQILTAEMKEYISWANSLNIVFYYDMAIKKGNPNPNLYLYTNLDFSATDFLSNIPEVRLKSDSIINEKVGLFLTINRTYDGDSILVVNYKIIDLSNKNKFLYAKEVWYLNDNNTFSTMREILINNL